MEGPLSASLSIRRDRTPAVLRKLAKNEACARIARRILGGSNALDGMSRENAARSAGMDRQTLRDWVLRYNEHGLDGLADRPRDGRPPTLTVNEKAELLAIVLAGSDPETSGLSADTLSLASSPALRATASAIRFACSGWCVIEAARALVLSAGVRRFFRIGTLLVL